MAKQFNNYPVRTKGQFVKLPLNNFDIVRKEKSFEALYFTVNTVPSQKIAIGKETSINHQLQLVSGYPEL